jgi:glycosyltransferase involved in cell wall biosynthesis
MIALRQKGILYFTSHYPGIGGGETYLFDLAKAFRSEFRIYFIEGGGNDELANLIAELGYPLERLDYSLFSAKKAALQLGEVCRKWDVDLVHFNNRRDAVLAYYLGDLRKVMTIHTCFFAKALGVQGNLRSAIMLMILRVTRGSIQRYITVTQYNASHLARFLGLPGGRVQAIYAGCTVPGHDDAQPMAERKLICSVARLDRSKGLEFLIGALSLLFDLPWECKIIGDGPDRSRLESLARRHLPQNRIHFEGTVPRDRVFAMIERSRMVVLPSLYDAFPYCLVEAMALGIPIITTRILGLPELIPGGNNGILVNPRDVKGLAEAIRELLMDNNLAANMGREGRRLAETQFSLSRMTEQTRNVYKDLLAT